MRSLGFPSHVILRPVFFMENLVGAWFLNGGKLHGALDPATKVLIIAVEGIGRFGARALTESARPNRREIDIASDAVSRPQAAATLSKALGRTIEFVRIPMDEVRRNSEDFALMLECFERVGYEADVAGLEREFGFKLLTLAAWAAKLPH